MKESLDRECVKEREREPGAFDKGKTEEGQANGKGAPTVTIWTRLL